MVNFPAVAVAQAKVRSLEATAQMASFASGALEGRRDDG